MKRISLFLSLGLGVLIVGRLQRCQTQGGGNGTWRW